MSKFILALFMFCSFAVIGQVNEESPVSKAYLDTLAAEFFASEKSHTMSLSTSAAKLFSRKNAERCDEDDQNSGSPSCVDVACEKLGRYNCDDVSEIQQVGEACRGNRGGACLAAACSKVGRYNCDDLSEIAVIGKACRGNFREACLEAVCARVGRYNCDDISEIRIVGEACRGTSASCIESVCNRVGRYNCDDLSEIEAVASSCRGD
jgi:hypothetical protein